MAVSLTLAGCGQNAADLVKAKVEQFAHAAASHNYEEICSQVLAPSLVAHLVSTGIACSEGLQVALGSVHDPVIDVGMIRVIGRRAYAAVLAGAQGQRAAVAGLELVETSRGWRIASLDSPVAAVVGGVGAGGATAGGSGAGGATAGGSGAGGASAGGSGAGGASAGGPSTAP